MGKRSDFKRRPMDAYDTPAKAVMPLLPFLIAEGVTKFAEPCSGQGLLVKHLKTAGLTCTYEGDIQEGQDALQLDASDVAGADVIITNPPWTRQLMHPLIWHLMSLGKPVWLLFDADWCHNRMAVPFLPNCSAIVSIGRVKWIENSKNTGKDNCCWYRFDKNHASGPVMYGRLIPSQLDMLGGPPTIGHGEKSLGNFVEVSA